VKSQEEGAIKALIDANACPMIENTLKQNVLQYAKQIQSQSRPWHNYRSNRPNLYTYTVN
jgi:hypothetical protein